jgi:hypothetical protein
VVAPAEDFEADIAPPATQPSRPGWLGLAIIIVLAALVAASVFFGGQAAIVTGDEVSLLGGPPVPHDRPLGLFGDGGGTGNLWADIGMQIALSFLMPLVSAAATAAVGWIVWQWNRVLKADFDAKSAESLHAAPRARDAGSDRGVRSPHQQGKADLDGRRLRTNV